MSAPPPRRTVALVGLMGAGKTSIGRRLAQRLGLPFIDADAEIEAAAGMSIEEIFQRHGEAAFRDGERRVIARLLEVPAHVLATGGGAFMDAATRALLRARAITVWLRADLELMLARVSRRSLNNRPLLKGRRSARRARGADGGALSGLCRGRHHRRQRSTGRRRRRSTVCWRRFPAAAPRCSPRRRRDPAPSGSPSRSARAATTSCSAAACIDRRRRAAGAGDPPQACRHRHRRHMWRRSISRASPRRSPPPASSIDAIVLPPGEATKDFAHFAGLCEDVLALGIERATPLVALGGGVIGDLAGFAAATLLRGLDLRAGADHAAGPGRQLRRRQDRDRHAATARTSSAPFTSRSWCSPTSTCLPPCRGASWSRATPRW